ncbi:hypothetical protein [Paracoccus indicus]|uniref:hypothetical protein n=1 Tax=Paracoccus indicus TaxID=2079229 RepID=UPI000D33D38A|nr:hypothetical protein [Paracoccus indicus]
MTSGAPLPRRVPDPLTRGQKVRITRLRYRLLDWYAVHGRDLPWRHDPANTFERICVEVLLQRTRAETVAKVYPTFFGRLRSWADIAAAPVEELEEHFKPIGLWQRRARSMKALSTFAAERGGQFPDTVDGLAHVPAVGQYVANAILVFQHGENRPLLDVNMARVIERYVRPRRLADIRFDPWLQEAAHWLVRGDKPVDINWAVLDFASAICTARNPRCSACPVARRCSSRQS